jgi:hypothetical protein
MFNLWLMLFERLKGSGLRVRHESASKACFYWGDTPDKCNLSTLEFACLRVL